MSWLLLLALTALAAFAALGVTLRAEPEGRAETGVLFLAVLYGIVCAPIFVLGYTNILYPWLLALSSAATSAGAFFASARGRSRREHARQIARAARSLARIPRDAFAIALRERSFALLGLACASLALAASAWLTFLAPSESWDGFFYHEPIVGYAIQNHGFRMVSLPPNMVVQGTNGYPRLCEAFALWFVIFTDKTFIEIGNTVAAPGLMLGVYLIGRRVSDDAASLLGWSAAILLMPAMLTQTRTSMIDVEVAFFLIAAVHFATRPVLRLRDAVAASLAMALIAGSKSTALTWVPPIAIVAYGRLLIANRRERRWQAIAVVAGGGLAVAGVAALTFVRNWIAFKSPLWPVSYSNPRLGIEWPGLITLARISPDPPLRQIINLKYHRPTGGVADIIVRDYGYGIPWVVVPLALLSVAGAALVAIRGRLRSLPEPETENLLLVAALGAAFIKGSPSLNIARYNAQIIAIAMVCIAWAARRLKSARFHEGAIATTLILTMVPMVWTDWIFGLPTDGIVMLHRKGAAERATMNTMPFQMPPDVAREREKDLGRGDLVIFTQETAFPGILWNHAMSNRVEYVPFTGEQPFLTAIQQQKPKWIVVGESSKARTLLEKRTGEWELVGVAMAQDKTVALRRRAR